MNSFFSFAATAQVPLPPFPQEGLLPHERIRAATGCGIAPAPDIFRRARWDTPPFQKNFPYFAVF
jgi:hypothetical protein